MPLFPGRWGVVDSDHAKATAYTAFWKYGFLQKVTQKNALDWDDEIETNASELLHKRVVKHMRHTIATEIFEKIRE